MAGIKSGWAAEGRYAIMASLDAAHLDEIDEALAGTDDDLLPDIWEADPAEALAEYLYDRALDLDAALAWELEDAATRPDCEFDRYLDDYATERWAA